MIYEKIDLYEYCSVPRNGRTGGYLTVVGHDKEGEITVRKRPAMLVLPGGGYAHLSDREGEIVAMRYFVKGYQTFWLAYSLNAPFPADLIEAAMAMVYIRENALSLRVDEAHVAAIGFSAGGHLCALLSNLYACEEVKAVLGERAALARPDASLLCYGVLSTGEYTHGGTAEIVSGGNGELRARLSPEKLVTEATPPSFLWHTVEDNCVPVQCSLLYAGACLEAGVPVEVHLFEQGWHGLSVLDRDVHITLDIPQNVARNAAWIDLSLSWLTMHGFEVGEMNKG